MAKVKFSALVSEMRNKLNGSVFSRNRGGSYLRNKVTPINPQTAAQVAARGILASYSSGWRGLTQAQRDAWNAAVAQFATTDIFGDIRNPTGLQLYIRLNANIQIAGGAPITTPPLPVGVDALTSLTCAPDSAVPGVVLTFGASPVPAGHAYYVEATAALSAGISNANSYFRFIQLIAAAATTPQDIYPAWNAKFGTLTAGKKVFARVKSINITTGEVSLPLVASGVIA